jgi:hypothetical protein
MVIQPPADSEAAPPPREMIPEKGNLIQVIYLTFSGITETKTEVSFLFFFDQKPGCPVYITH